MKDQNIEKLYDKQSLDIMRHAEDSWVRGANRIIEIKNFARQAGIKRIGVANCVSFPEETRRLVDILSDEFEVYPVDCKFGRVTQHEILNNEKSSIICNPAGQADYLKTKETELNISMGLCVGHDMVFNQKSHAPVTNLIVKDQVNRKNPMESFGELGEK
jgi:uncharacterized metal-binding protein